MSLVVCAEAVAHRGAVASQQKEVIRSVRIVFPVIFRGHLLMPRAHPCILCRPDAVVRSPSPNRRPSYAGGRRPAG